MEKVTAVLGNIPFHKGNACDSNSRQNLSQLPVIIPVELCMSSKLFYKVSFVFIKLSHIFAGHVRSYGKQPLLWPLLRKKNLCYCVLSLNFTLI